MERFCTCKTQQGDRTEGRKGGERSKYVSLADVGRRGHKGQRRVWLPLPPPRTCQSGRTMASLHMEWEVLKQLNGEVNPCGPPTLWPASGDLEDTGS